MTSLARRALIAMSGGVDSAVAAKLMLEQGYDCVGCTMRLYDNEDAGISRSRTCCSLDDVEDARSVAYRLGIPFYVFNLTDAFREEVIGHFIRSYESGVTPNPCIECNRKMKFGRLFDKAELLECDFVVTGHYARISYDGTRYLLHKALDPDKDQSYVLYSMTQGQLARTQFPLGRLTKPEVREIAAANGFSNAQKPDSQDICFVPDGDYARVIQLHTGKKPTPGSFLDENGNVLGTHKGIIHYTVGQRKGLGISSDSPLYVTAIDPVKNTVTLSHAGGVNSGLYTREVVAHDVNLIVADKLTQLLRVRAKLRYRQPEQPATVEQIDEDTLLVRFDEPQRAAAKGQAVVLYDGETVVGGGTIS